MAYTITNEQGYRKTTDANGNVIITDPQGNPVEQAQGNISFPDGTTGLQPSYEPAPITPVIAARPTPSTVTAALNKPPVSSVSTPTGGAVGPSGSTFQRPPSSVGGAEGGTNPLNRPPDFAVSGDLMAIVNEPMPTPTGDAAKDLTNMQLWQARHDSAWSQIMEPHVLETQGMMRDPVTKAIRPMTEGEKYQRMTPAEKDNYNNNLLIANRAKKAAAGQLEVPDYVTEAVKKQNQAGGLLASQRLGAKGANVSTAGINLKNAGLANEAAVKSNYSYGQESQGAGLLNNYDAFLGNQSAQNQNTYSGMGSSNMLPVFNAGLQPYTFGRQLQNEHEALDTNRNRGVYQGLLGGVGSAAGIVAGKMV